MHEGVVGVQLFATLLQGLLEFIVFVRQIAALVLAEDAQEFPARALVGANPVGELPTRPFVGVFHVEDHPEELAGADAGVPELVSLPRAGDGDVSGLQRPFVVVGGKARLATEHATDLDALVAMHGEPPGLGTDGIPVADGAKTREDARRKLGPGILSPAMGDQGDLAEFNRAG